MAASLEQFLAALADTGLMPKAEAQAFIGSLPADRQPKDGQALARELFQAGKLTRYQAAAIYQGKAAGLVFGEYLVLDKLGAGGMGQVFKAQHRRMKRIVALKVLPPQATKSEQAVRRFYQEVEMAGKLVHPNIVTAYDANEAGGLHYMAMEFVDGQDLSSLVRQHGPLPVDTAVNYMLQAARGLEFAHSLAIIHRDIKPGNLLVDRDGVLKILDMGLARLTEAAAAADKAAAEGLTQQGDVMGTAEYMAPEQALDPRQATFRADIYSLGCTFYRLVSGEMMYPGKKTAIQQILAHRGEPIPSMRAKRPEVPEAVEAVFLKMVAKQPADRYATTTELVKALAALGATPASAKIVVATASKGGPKDAEFASFLQNLSVAGPATVFKAQAGSQATRGPQSERSTSRSKSESAVATAPVAARRKLFLGGGIGVALVAVAVVLAVMFSGGEDEASDVADSNDMGQAVATTMTPTVTEKSASKVAESPAPAVTPPIKPPPKFVPPPPLPVIAPKSSPPKALTTTIDLIKLIDPRRDAVTGSWKLEGSSLIAMPTSLSRLMIPYTPPEEYTLTAVVERGSGPDGFGLGIVVGGSQCRVIFDAAQSTVSGLDMVDGQRFDKNVTSLSGFFVPPGAPVTIVCHVRRNGVQVLLNGRPFLAWSGDPKRLANAPTAPLPDPTRLFLSNHNTTFAFRKLEIGPLSPSAAFPPESPRSIAGQPQPGPAAPSYVAGPKLTERADLLKQIDPQRDAVVGTWTLSEGQLVAPVQNGALLQVPIQPPEEYVLALEVERTAGKDGFAFGVIVGGIQATMGFDNFYGTFSGLELIDSKRLNVNESSVPGEVLVAGERRVIVCSVRKNGVRTTVDGRPFMEWTGETKRLSPMSQWRTRDPHRLFLGAWNSGFRISRFEIAPIEQAAELEAAALPKAESAAPAAQKLAVPSDDALKQAREPLQALVGDDLSKPRKPEDAGLVATLLLKQSQAQEMEPTVWYLLLSEAQRLAALGGRLEPAFEAIEMTARRFDVDVSALEKRAVTEAVRQAKTPQVRQAIVEDALTLLDQMLSRGRYELANDLHDAALATVLKITNPTLLKEVRARTAEVKDLLKQWHVAQAAIETLKTAPEDAAAHLVLGRFLCLATAHWEEGLPHLAKGSDAALRAAAEEDLKNPTDAAERLKLADLWWDLAEKSPLAIKLPLMERAALWYERVPAAEQASSQARIAPRMEKLADARRSSPSIAKRHPLDALYWQGHWYKAFPDKLTWAAARQRCEELGGRLVCIESAAESEFLSEHIQALIPPDETAIFAVWIGLTDEATEGQFRWINGQPLSYTNWKPGEPNNSIGGEDFVAVARFSGERTRLRWNDFNGVYLAGYLCEWER